MKTSRNDPCPCGSGKKYKACCMARDQARAHARSVLGEEVFDQAEETWMSLARQEKTWAVEIAPALGSAREAPDAGLSLAMVTAGEWVLYAEVLAHRPAGAAERTRDLAAAVNAAARVAGVLPEGVMVPDTDVVEALGRELAGQGVAVEVGETDGMYEAMSSALAHMDPSPARGRMTFTQSWRETEASAEELRDFHEAAAAFFTAAPWTLEDEDFLLDLPCDPRQTIQVAGMELPERRQWAASVMGSLGEAFGLMLHSQPSDLESFYASEGLEAVLTSGIGFSLTVDFDRRSALPKAMQREAAAARWPVAAPHAYPRLFAMNLPGRWIRAADVRVATLALHAVAVFARGGDPLAETGVGVAPFESAEAEDESRLDWFDVPEEAAPVCAEGPGAAAQPRFLMWDSVEEHETRMAAEQERIDRFAEWLREQGVPEEEASVDLENVDGWKWHAGGMGSLGAATEFDLRLFLYDLYLRKTDPTPAAVNALPRSMRRMVQWLEEREGIRYPFAAGVLDELERIVARASELDEPLQDTLRILSYDVYDDLDIRGMLPASRGWPDLMNVEVAQLREELQRRWLLWYDELVRGGVTDLGDLEDALLGRQREWEATPPRGSAAARRCRWWRSM